MGDDLYQRQRRRFNNRQKRNAELKQIAKRPEIRRFYIYAIISAVIGIILLLTLAIFLDQLSDKLMLLLRGFTGLFAIISVIFTAIFYYKMFSTYRKNQYEKGE